MRARAFFVTLFTPLFLSILTLAFNIQPARAESRTWIVDDDGPADFRTIQEAINAASSADTISVAAGTYYENVVVKKSMKLIGEDMDNTIIDGGKSGIVLCITADNVAITNFTIAKGHPNLCGMYMNSSNNSIEGNIIAENNWGIQFYESHNNVISSNLIISNSLGIYMIHCDHNTIDGNNITGNNIGGAHMRHSTRNLFNRNIIIKNGGTGIFGADCSFSAFNENVLMENKCGINIVDSRHVQCVGNAFFNNTYYGLRMEDCSYYALVAGNSITGHEHGVWTHVSHFNVFIKNMLARNVNGFSFNGYPSGLNNILRYNDIINNTVGVHLWYADHTQFGKNNFVDNTLHVQSEGSINHWDEGYTFGGNYWRDHNGTDMSGGPYQNVTGGDGIADTPYVVAEYNQDNYPLMEPVNAFHVGTWDNATHYVDIVSNSTISNFALDIPERIISFNVTDTEVGFCRVTIPNVIVQELWQGNYTVLVDGEKPLTLKNWTNQENTCVHFTYKLSEHEVTIIPQFPSTLVLLSVIIFLTAVVVIMAKIRLTENLAGPVHINGRAVQCLRSLEVC